ncbi:hypothetical protein ACU4GD_08445 [Cupriavidus basilensis]
MPGKWHGYTQRGTRAAPSPSTRHSAAPWRAQWDSNSNPAKASKTKASNSSNPVNKRGQSGSQDQKGGQQQQQDRGQGQQGGQHDKQGQQGQKADQAGQQKTSKARKAASKASVNHLPA